MKQTYFGSPKYSKNYLVLKPQNLYEYYVNAFAFSEMVKSQNSTPNKRELQQKAQDNWREIRTKNKEVIQNLISELLKTPIQSPLNFFTKSKPATERTEHEPLILIPDIVPNPSDELPRNAVAQRQSSSILQNSKNDLHEYKRLLEVATSSELRSQFILKIHKLEDVIMSEKRRLKMLKGNAAAQARLRNKKRQKLEKENIVEIYDTPGRPSFLMNDPNLLEKMHNSIEFGAADHKRRKEVIKVRTIKHLREKMEEDYGIYMAKSTVRKYLQPRHPGTKEAQRHHHPAQIRLAAVGRNEMNDHVDEHYCLALVKGIKSFASVFSQDVVLISQDDKAKVCICILFSLNYLITNIWMICIRFH